MPWKSLLEYKYQSKLTNKFKLQCVRKEAVFDKHSRSVLLSHSCQSYWGSFLVMLSYYRYQGDIWQSVSYPLCLLRETFAVSLTQKWRCISVLVCVSKGVTRATITGEEPIFATSLFFMTQGPQGG